MDKLGEIFHAILIDLIERIDDGYNILNGNDEVAEEYASKLIKEVQKDG